MNIKAIALAFILPWTGLQVASAGDSGSLIEKARQLLADKQPEQAYGLLAGYELEYAGNPAYDYWLGLAASSSRQYVAATIAFERVLIIKPDYPAARLDLALAYLKLGDYERALNLLDKVRAQALTPAVRTVVDEAISRANLLAATDGVALQRRLTGFVSMTLGNDSNVNAAADLAYLDAPEQSDQFAGLNAGMTLELPVNNRSQFEIRGLAGLMEPKDYDEYANVSLFGSLAYQFFDQNDARWEIGLNLSDMRLDDAGYFEQEGVWVGWRKAADPNNLLDIAGHWAQARYDDNVDIYDYDRSMLISRLLHRPSGKTLLASFGLIAGYDDAVNGRPDGDNIFYGASFGLQGPVSFASLASINFKLTQYDYQNRNVRVQAQREDTQLDVNLGLTWSLQDNLNLSADLQMISHASNDPVYAYDRSILSMTLRRDF